MAEISTTAESNQTQATNSLMLTQEAKEYLKLERIKTLSHYNRVKLIEITSSVVDPEEMQGYVVVQVQEKRVAREHPCYSKSKVSFNELQLNVLD